MRVGTGVLFLLLCGVLAIQAQRRPLQTDRPAGRSGVGDVEFLKARYSAWSESTEGTMWTVPLGRSNGHAVGDASDLRATFNPATGDFDVFAQGLTEGEVAVWFVDNQPGPNRSAMPETGDRTIRFGLTENGRLTDKLDPTELSGFEVDVVVLTTPDG
ncbi:MAG: hypothetical protein ACI84D_003251, partial [Thalassolituus oleivorans]